jgi:regulator of cell morphogenesis and NO signaling
MAVASRTVRQIAIDQPSAIDVFDRMGIEYCCKGWQTLQDACSEIAISVKDVVRALDQAAAGDRAGNSRFESKTFEFLILRVLRNQHGRVREELPILQGIAATEADRHRVRHPELAVIDELLQKLSLELTTHLSEEEGTLFPALLELELAYLGESPILGYPKRVRNILNGMSQQHDTSSATLRQIRAASHSFCPPERVATPYCEFYDRLQKFFRELHRDFHMENNILFPQAAQMEAEIFRGSRFSRS